MKKFYLSKFTILASFGNTTLDNACRNAIALKKYLGLSGQVVKGLPDPKTNVVDTTLSETSFHGRDGLANISKQLNSICSRTSALIKYMRRSFMILLRL